MDTKPTCEDVTIPDPVVKVDSCLLPAVSTPGKRDTYVNELIFVWKMQKIGSNFLKKKTQKTISNLLALLRRISALTNLFSAKKNAENNF
jgi:hypothetical protein